MGSTPQKGLPWPEPTQFLGQTNLYIRQLAEAVELMRPDYLDMLASASQPATNGSWTQTGVGTVNNSRGSGIIPWGSNLGIKCTRAGRFLVIGMVEFSANATGRRGLGYTTTPDSPAAPTRWRNMVNANASGTTPVSFAFVNTIAAGGGFSLMAYQDSGTSLTMTNQSLSVQEI